MHFNRTKDLSHAKVLMSRADIAKVLRVRKDMVNRICDKALRGSGGGRDTSEVVQSEDHPVA